MALGTVIAASVGIGRSLLKARKKTRRSNIGRGFVAGGQGPVLFEDRTLPAGGGVRAAGTRVAEIATGGAKGGMKGEIDLETGEVTEKRRRRRRKRLLTCADRQDITFITATLGKGQMAQTAIASLLARCN